METINKLIEDMVVKKEPHTSEVCLVARFFANEAKKPLEKRTNICMISCPCSKCRPTMMPTKMKCRAKSRELLG